MFSFIIYANLVFSSEIPSDALALLNELPNRKVHLSYVLQSAVNSSDSYQRVLAQKELAPVSRLAAKAQLDAQTYIKFGELKDKFEPLNSAMPSSTQARTFTLGVAKRIESGTSLAFELNHGPKTFGFAGNTFPQVYDTNWSLMLSQSLIQDSFGYATRREKKAGQVESEANQLQFLLSQQDWANAISQLFYYAWQSQYLVKTTSEGLLRRQKLLDVSRIKLRRGTTERPDFLQIEAAYNLSKIQNKEAITSLQQAWHRLITILNLPSDWLEINASLVPLDLDEPFLVADQVCSKNTKESNNYIQMLKAKNKAANLNVEAKKNLRLPDLKIEAMIAGNGVDPKSAEALKEANRLENEKWYLGLHLSMPLRNYGANAAYRAANAEKILAQANLSEAQTSFKADWLEVCQNYKVAQSNFKLQKDVLNKQKERLRLEEERFRIGRASVFQVIQAGDDLSASEFQLSASEVNRRTKAWKVLQLGDSVPDYLGSMGVSLR